MYAYTPRYISETRRYKPKRKNYLILGFILESTQIPANASTERIETSYKAFFLLNAIFSLEYAINHRFFDISRRKAISS
jgi:hypothetical protein